MVYEVLLSMPVTQTVLVLFYL